MTQFEESIQHDLHRYLLMEQEIDERLPDAPDIEEKWESIAEAYMPDGISEFNANPIVPLGWIMYVGMAIAKFWDTEWQKYSTIENIYLYLRDKRGYDAMDDFIREEVLGLQGDAFNALERLVGECASRTYSQLRHASFEPGTKDSFNAFVECLHQLYLMGASVQLKRMGYRMTKM